MKNKKCIGCEEIKDFAEFHNDNRNNDGIKSRCKICTREYSLQHYRKNREHLLEKSRVWSNENKDRVKQNHKEYYKKTAEKQNLYSKQYYQDNKNQKKIYLADYKKKNKDKISAWHKKNYEKNKEKIKEQHKVYRDNNKDKTKAYQSSENGKICRANSAHKRRTKKRTGDVTSTQLRHLKESSKVCYWCNCSFDNKKVHIDHYVPLSKGGEHTISNLVIACSVCNLSKGSKDPVEFAASIGKLL